MEGPLLGKILILEDDPGIALLERKQLERVGHKVCVASEISDALQCLEGGDIDAILIDYSLPGELNGLQFFISLRERGYELPALLITGFSNETKVIEALRAGIRDFIPKSPEYLEYLPGAVQRVLEEAQTRRRLRETYAALAVANEQLRALNEQLENKVLERTTQLEAAIGSLEREVAERRRAEIFLQDADRRKDEFLAMLAHELRNPLSPIRNSVQVLQMSTASDPTAQRVYGIIERQVAHMARLIDDLLDVSRISRGKILLRRSRVDFVELVRTTLNDYGTMFDSKSIELHCQLPDTPCWVRGDPTRLSQVVGNILHNSSKFTGSGGSVEVTLQTEGSEVALSIRDTGIGMDSEMLTRLFQPFSQADQSLDRSRGGLGLGLALAKGLIDLHQGSLVGTSPGLGKGAQFVIRLPIDVSAAPEVPATDHSSEAPASLRILIIEDNRDTAESMRMLLELSGHEVATADSGLEGLARFRQFQPGVVLCDIGLPGGINGFEVAATIRQEVGPDKVRLIALTGYGQESDLRNALAAGFDQHLVKPIAPETLSQVLAGQRPSLPSRTSQ